MTFDPNIPLPADELVNSQGDLLTNFTELDTQFGINHVEFSDTTGDAGKHKFATFIEQADDPVSKGDEYILYSKEDTAGNTELHARPEAGKGAAYQITKDGFLNLGIIPFAAVNFDNLGAPRGTPIGLDAVTPVVKVADGRYRLDFSAATTTLLAGSNDYLWNVSAFDNSSQPVISFVTNNADYGTVVKDTSIMFDFKHANDDFATGLVAATVILWRFQ